MDKPLLAVTMGDPAGIGPEVVLKTVLSGRGNNAARMVVVGFPGPFLRDAELLDLHIEVNEIDSVQEIIDKPYILNLIVPDRKLNVPIYYGVVDRLCGLVAGRCIERSAELAMSGEVDGIVTAPINKDSLNRGGFAYPGHTEFYQHLINADNIAMMLTLGSFRVIHVVCHTAIRDVPDLIRKKRIVWVATQMYEALKLLGIEYPRLAVSGLNPHAGESGMFGREEISEILPAVEHLRAEGKDVTGPFPPDTVFARAYCGEFDGVVAMYHDQGHIAMKLAGFKIGEGEREVGGVNTTLGLPVIRTSVDHGTAFDIAGKGTASPLSMIEAVEMASALVKGKKAKG